VQQHQQQRHEFECEAEVTSPGYWRTKLIELQQQQQQPMLLPVTRRRRRPGGGFKRLLWRLMSDAFGTKIK
jgi:hypothetical protein